MVWFGMTAAISLLETPISFSALTLTRSVALDVGRGVFEALNKAEWVALLLVTGFHALMTHPSLERFAP